MYYGDRSPIVVEVQQPTSHRRPTTRGIAVCHSGLTTRGSTLSPVSTYSCSLMPHGLHILYFQHSSRVCESTIHTGESHHINIANLNTNTTGTLLPQRQCSKATQTMRSGAQTFSMKQISLSSRLRYVDLGDVFRVSVRLKLYPHPHGSRQLGHTRIFPAPCLSRGYSHPEEAPEASPPLVSNVY
jgi:hypothetical protein